MLRSHPSLRFLLPLTAGLTLPCASALQAQTHQFEPWHYDSSGNTVWQRHQNWEDNTSTAFVLAREVYTPAGQPSGSYPEVFLFNQAQFIPPDGEPAAMGQRRIAQASYTVRGIQLYLNFSKAPIPNYPGRAYPEPEFFVAVTQNSQINATEQGLNPSAVAISATRAAFGHLGATGTPYAIVRPLHAGPAPAFPVDALYVTAGVGYPKGDFTQPNVAHDLSKDQLLVLNTTTNTWTNKSSIVPDSARDGHSSGACFADFDGDGDLDLYVGLTGDNFTGAQNALLYYDPAGGGSFKDVTTTNIDIVPVDATWDVIAANLNPSQDNYPDIVVANRKPRGTASPSVSYDYALFNDGTGHFKYAPFPAVPSDSRSVDVGDLDGDGWPEIVLGNAGSDGYSNSLTIPDADDDPIQIFSMTPPGSWVFVDNAATFIGNTERNRTSPWTAQVILANVTQPNANGPGSPHDNGPDANGSLDLLIVNHRDILQGDPTLDSNPGNVVLLANRWPASVGFDYVGEMPAAWATSAALADYCVGILDEKVHTDPLDDVVAEANSLDLFIGTGNRFAGSDSRLFQNAGDVTGTSSPFNTNADKTFMQLMSYDPMPGNERGYGFDFAVWDTPLDDVGGHIGAAQFSRGYDFLVQGLLSWLGNLFDHVNLTSALPSGPSTSVSALSNHRGALVPRGGEDGVFADFDDDGDADLLAVGSGLPSLSILSAIGTNYTYGASAKVLENTGGNNGMDHLAETLIPYSNNSSGTPWGIAQFPLDARIDPLARIAGPRQDLADRAVAGDLDNDGDVDALVHLDAVLPPGWNPPYVPFFSDNGTSYDPPGALVAQCSLGWMYLENIVNQSGSARWFQDVAPNRMLDNHRSAGGAFSGQWNRGLGMDILADFDNNGALDLYTTNGGPGDVTPGSPNQTLESVLQTRDLLFLNEGHDDWGTLVQAPASTLPIVNNIYGNANLPPETFGLCWGDIDNDGDADAVTTHAFRAPRAFTSLLVNQWVPGGTLTFTDEYLSPARGIVSYFDPAVHSIQAPSPYAAYPLDDAEFPALFDFDADGDQDLVLAIARNIPRFYENLGADLNGDGWITAFDNSGLGTFHEVTSALARWIRPTTDANDMTAVDLDGDGDLDLAIDPFDDEVVLWRNDLPTAAGGIPAISEAWPRVGARERAVVLLHGVDFAGVNQRVQLRCANGAVISGSNVTALGDNRLQFTIPLGTPLGLAQIRVGRREAPGRPFEWSRQYFGYFVLERP